MNRLRWFLFGALAVGVAGITAFTAFVLSAHGFSADVQPGGLETRVARLVRSAAVPGDARGLANPVPDSPEVEAAALAHWADHCAGCHANDGSGDVLMGKRTWPPAPDMRLPQTQQMSDGELFYIIENGVRFSAMPAWGTGSARDTEDSWKLVRFIRHLPKLSDEEKKEIQGMNPRSPEEIREEEQEEKFLKGEGSNEPQIDHHDH
jgi:mono/diheme cytochrome c family protein